MGARFACGTNKCEGLEARDVVPYDTFKNPDRIAVMDPSTGVCGNLGVLGMLLVLDVTAHMVAGR